MFLCALLKDAEAVLMTKSPTPKWWPGDSERCGKRRVEAREKLLCPRRWSNVESLTGISEARRVCLDVLRDMATPL